MRTGLPYVSCTKLSGRAGIVFACHPIQDSVSETQLASGTAVALFVSPNLCTQERSEERLPPRRRSLSGQYRSPHAGDGASKEPALPTLGQDFFYALRVCGIKRIDFMCRRRLKRASFRGRGPVR